MKNAITVAAVVAAMTIGAWAENEVTATPAAVGEVKPAGIQRAKDGAKDGVRGDRGAQHMQELIKKYDADGDGKLSEKERETARAAFELEMQARMLERFTAMDKDGNGSVSKEEWLESAKGNRAPMMGHGRGAEAKKADEGKKADASTVKDGKAEAAPAAAAPQVEK